MVRETPRGERTEGRYTGLLIGAGIVVVLGIVLVFSVVFSPLGLAVIFVGVVLAAFALFKRGDIGKGKQ